MARACPASSLPSGHALLAPPPRHYPVMPPENSLIQASKRFSRRRSSKADATSRGIKKHLQILGYNEKNPIEEAENIINRKVGPYFLTSCLAIILLHISLSNNCTVPVRMRDFFNNLDNIKSTFSKRLFSSEDKLINVDWELVSIK